jgi:hypothetical protein
LTTTSLHNSIVAAFWHLDLTEIGYQAAGRQVEISRLGQQRSPETTRYLSSDGALSTHNL